MSSLGITELFYENNLSLGSNSGGKGESAEVTSSPWKKCECGNGGRTEQRHTRLHQREPTAASTQGDTAARGGARPARVCRVCKPGWRDGEVVSNPTTPFYVKNVRKAGIFLNVHYIYKNTHSLYGLNNPTWKEKK